MAKITTKEAGFTLVELIATITILSVLIAIAIPAVSQIIERSERESCDISVRTVEEHYHNFLMLEDLEHNDVRFQFFLSDRMDYNEQDHHFIYENDHVRCTIYQPIKSDEEEPEPVPWL